LKVNSKNSQFRIAYYPRISNFVQIAHVACTISFYNSMTGCSRHSQLTVPWRNSSQFWRGRLPDTPEVQS
jgi:hypothetical protein